MEAQGSKGGETEEKRSTPAVPEEDGGLHLSLKGLTVAGNTDSSNSNSNSNSSTPIAGAQLTIFYGGSISVYDAVPPEKAQAIMFIAAAAAAAAAASASVTNNKNIASPVILAGDNAATAAASPVLSRSPSLQSSSAAVVVAPQQMPQILLNPNKSFCKLQAELPIARRHSLQRFLEKRRDRLVSKAPYPSVKESEHVEAAAREGKPQLSLVSSNGTPAQ